MMKHPLSQVITRFVLYGLFCMMIITPIYGQEDQDSDLEIADENAELENESTELEDENASLGDEGKADSLIQIQADIAKLKQETALLIHTLQLNLSEKEIKTLRKKQSKDISHIILRFQDRIDYIEQQTTTMTGQVEEIQFKLVTIEENLENLMGSYSQFTRINSGKQGGIAELLAQQTRLLKAQQKTIKKQSEAINRLEKNHNALIKQLQKGNGKISKLDIGSKDKKTKEKKNLNNSLALK